ncbi:thiamine pyrophosphate-dependent enzyme [Methanobrevibacter filiformis]|uniref:Indolepyruvate oxidoreductase subunit IorA n=1 Tax=Methanobrevibacter filiformis TaxID=55758 RepID=A0A162FM41_9EURY|nr:thiamine pyrophosphate-dependent enzyme [Methanobrevibacter filiformis]KZX12030.1 2-oxoacid ferredoxin oxidoreductase [Methanobrevibacter filiformis]
MELKKLISGNNENLFLLGNEAAVRGAIEAGISVASTYPGTPSSEIGDLFSVLAKDSNIYFEFSVNEKVAMEVVAAAAASGLRSFTFMKHVGLNVASDSFMSVAYTGVKGGMVVLTADDPSMFSSQNEQDNRNYARIANVPVLEPSNPQEIKDMVIYGFELSEMFKLPVIVRTTTRVSHMRGIVEIGEININNTHSNTNNNINNTNTDNINNKEISSNVDSNVYWTKGRFEKNPKQFIPVPENALVMHKELVFKINKIEEIANRHEFNKIFKFNENNSYGNFGVITSGSAFNYVYDVVVKDNLGLDIFKLGFSYPFPRKAFLEFIKDKSAIFVAEEVDPIIEKDVLAIIAEFNLNVVVFGKLNNVFPLIYEFNPDIVRNSLNKVFAGIKSIGVNFTDSNSTSDLVNKCSSGIDFNLLKNLIAKFNNESYDSFNPTGSYEDTWNYNKELNDLIESLPLRPPTFCAGCGHRATYFAVKRAVEELDIAEKDVIYASDIGCYTLGINPPYETADYSLSMGASIGDGCGFSKATNQKVLSFIGDSTFFHSGVSPLINAVHNKSNFVVTILDNRITAMTGGQPNPGVPVDGVGDDAPEIPIVDIAIAIGAKFVRIINPINMKKTVETYKEAIEFDGVSVIIAKYPCVFVKSQKKKYSMEIDYNKCTDCFDCVNLLACPAISIISNKSVIDSSACRGCTTCVQMCKSKAIKVKRSS